MKIKGKEEMEWAFKAQTLRLVELALIQRPPLLN